MFVSKELTFAWEHTKKNIIPLLAEPGYDYRKDGWLGILLCRLLSYDISSVKKRDAELAAMLQKEMNSGLSAAPMTSTPPVASPPSVAVAIPEGEEEVRKWAESVGLDKSVADGLVREGYVNRVALESLLEESSTEVKGLLGLQGASATLLKDALKDLFGR